MYAVGFENITVGGWGGRFRALLCPLFDAQAIFYNIKNFLTFQLSTAVAALSIVAVATFLGFKCPINAMQVCSNTCLRGLRYVFAGFGATKPTSFTTADISAPGDVSQ